MAKEKNYCSSSRAVIQCLCEVSAKDGPRLLTYYCNVMTYFYSDYSPTVCHLTAISCLCRWQRVGFIAILWITLSDASVIFMTSQKVSFINIKWRKLSTRCAHDSAWVIHCLPPCLAKINATWYFLLATKIQVTENQGVGETMCPQCYWPSGG